MTQKELATQCLEKLNIYKPYIRKFKSKVGIPCFFENFGGFYVDQEPEIWNKVKEVEKEYDVLIYAITHEFTEFGECWSMLCVSQNPDSLDDFISEIDNGSGRSGQFYTYAYVWNKTEPMFSEFGDIVVRSFGGGIKRVG
jgi:hypothetical protein